MNNNILFLGDQYITSYDDFVRVAKLACTQADGNGMHLRTELLSAVRDGIISDWLTQTHIQMAPNSIFLSDVSFLTDSSLFSGISKELGIANLVNINWEGYLKLDETYRVEKITLSNMVGKSNSDDSREYHIEEKSITYPLDCVVLRFFFRLKVVETCNECIQVKAIEQGTSPIEIETMEIDLRKKGEVYDIWFVMSVYQNDSFFSVPQKNMCLMANNKKMIEVCCLRQSHC